MIKLTQLLGIILILMGIVIIGDAYTPSYGGKFLGIKMRGGSIPFLGDKPGLESFIGIALVVIGVFVAVPKLSELMEGR